MVDLPNFTYSISYYINQLVGKKYHRRMVLAHSCRTSFFFCCGRDRERWGGKGFGNGSRSQLIERFRWLVGCMGEGVFLIGVFLPGAIF